MRFKTRSRYKNCAEEYKKIVFNFPVKKIFVIPIRPMNLNIDVKKN